MISGQFLKCIGVANCLDELVNLVGAFDALVTRAIYLYARADIYGQRFTARPQGVNACGHVGSVESTRQDELTVDAWWKK